MSKKHRKRSKKYHGEDAAAPIPSEPVVHRYSAVDRGRVGQWWHERKKVVTTTAKILGITALVGWLLYELVLILT
jgi:hypothetical protein